MPLQWPSRGIFLKITHQTTSLLGLPAKDTHRSRPSPSMLPLLTLPQPHWPSYFFSMPSQFLPHGPATGPSASDAPAPGYWVASIFMSLRSWEVLPAQGNSQDINLHSSIPFVTRIFIRMVAPWCEELVSQLHGLPHILGTHKVLCSETYNWLHQESGCLWPGDAQLSNTSGIKGKHSLGKPRMIIKWMRACLRISNF